MKCTNLWTKGGETTFILHELTNEDILIDALEQARADLDYIAMISDIDIDD